MCLTIRGTLPREGRRPPLLSAAGSILKLGPPVARDNRAWPPACHAALRWASITGVSMRLSSVLSVASAVLVCASCYDKDIEGPEPPSTFSITTSVSTLNLRQDDTTSFTV